MTGSSGDIEFGEFMAARWATLFRTAYLLTGERHEAEDLLQTVLARTCVRWHTIRDKQVAEGYECTVDGGCQTRIEDESGTLELPRD
jgi:hypothetical protein